MRSLFRSKRHRWTLGMLLSLFVATSAGLWSMVAADVTGPSAHDRQVINIVTNLLSDQHLSRRALDNEVSRRAFQSFLDGLDPMKVYFYQSDVDQFAGDREKLDDMLLNLDSSFAYKTFQVFLKRVEERVQLVDEMLAVEHDFSANEEIDTDRDMLKYPRDEAEARERWRKRIKWDLLVLKGDKTEGKEAIDRLTRRYHNFERRMKQFDNDELLEMFLTSVTSSYDPHTQYMSRSTLENFRIALGLKLEGIGAQLKDEDGQTVIAKIVPGGAADKHGKLKAEDRIVSVGQGETGEMVDTVDMKLNDVVKMIRGDAGTLVRLGVLSPGIGEVQTLKITRAKIELNDSAAQSKIFDAGKKADGSPFKIGVIDLPSFYMDMEAARKGADNFRSTTADVREILRDFTEKRVDGLVLDLRRNGGGSLIEAIHLTGLFIDEGPIVQVKGPDNRVQFYRDPDQGKEWDGPLVVLTSQFSASASEILAGAIQDYRRGIIVGDKSTHGKGTVQSLLDLGTQLFAGPARAPNLGALKITMQQFYRPNGDSTQKRGVLADITLPSVTSHMDVGESDLDYAVEFERVERARYKPESLVDDAMLTTLRTRSMQRRQESKDFDKLLEKIERYQKQKAKKSVTLNEEKFFAERAKLDAEKEEQEQLEEQDGDSTERIDRDYYLEEVLSTTVDYIQQIGKRKKVAQAR